MYKSKLQELCHQRSWSLPEYVTTKEGPDHIPRFTATVHVGGVTFETTDQCHSSKEAQNEVAKIAFNHLSSINSIGQHRQQPITGSSLSHFSFSLPSDFSTHNDNMGNRHASRGIPQPPQPSQSKDVQTPQANETSLSIKECKTSKEIIHLYKNRLQNYAQKRNLTLPMYSSESEGPPHARRFKSKVTFDGKTYETSEFYSTLKEAEHAAAKVAFEFLAPHEVPEDGGLFKSLLQEWAQRESLEFPVYETTKLGPPHMPTFVSTVKIGGEVFCGEEAKIKKQAEMSAAKSAYVGLSEHQETKNLRVLSPGGHLMSSTEITSSSSQLFTSNGSQQVVRPGINHTIHTEQAEEKKGSKLSVFSPGTHINEDLMVSTSKEQSIVSGDIQQNCKQLAKIVICDEQYAEGKDNNSTKYGSLASLGTKYPSLQDPCPSTSSTYGDNLSSSSLSSVYSSNSVTMADFETSAATSPVPGKKILVYPRGSNMMVPDGATMLPFSDNKWIAVELQKLR